MKNKILFIFLISFIIFLVGCVESVSAQQISCKEPTGTTCTLNSNIKCTDTLILPSRTITEIIIPGATKIYTEYNGDIPGDCFMNLSGINLKLQGGNLEGNFNIIANKIILSSGSRINANYFGYKGRVTDNVPTKCSPQKCCDGDYICGSTGFVNDGGISCWYTDTCNNIVPGSAGGIQNDCDYGRGGGEPRKTDCGVHINQPKGGNGGGRIIISAQELTIDSTSSITANGYNGEVLGNYVSAGGSGGKVIITTTKLNVQNNFILNKGGDGAYKSGIVRCGGGASGGSVQINYVESSQLNENAILNLIDVSGGRAGYPFTNCKDGGDGQKFVYQNTFGLSLTVYPSTLNLTAGEEKSVTLSARLTGTVTELKGVEFSSVIPDGCKAGLTWNINGLGTHDLTGGDNNFPLKIKFTGSLSNIISPQCRILLKAETGDTTVDVPLSINLIPQISFTFSPNPYPTQYVLKDSEATLPSITITNNGEMAFDFNFSGGRSFLDYNYNKLTVGKDGTKTLGITSKNLSSGSYPISIGIIPCFPGTTFCYESKSQTVRFSLEVLDLNLVLTPDKIYDKNNPQPINIKTEARLGSTDVTSKIRDLTDILIIDKTGNEESCLAGKDLTASPPIIKCYPGVQSRNLEDGRKYDVRVKFKYNSDGATILDVEKVVSEAIEYKDVTPPIIDPFLQVDWQQQDDSINFKIIVKTKDVTGTNSAQGQLTFPNGTSQPVGFTKVSSLYDNNEGKFIELWQSEDLTTLFIDKNRKHKLNFSAADQNENANQRTFEFTFADKIKFSGSLKDVDDIEKGKIASFDINSLIQGKSFSFASTLPNGDYSKDIGSGEYDVIIKNTENPELSGDSVAYHNVLLEQDTTDFITAFGESPAISQQLPVDVEPIKIKTLAVISDNNNVYDKVISFNYRNLVEDLKVDINNLMILHCPSWDFENKFCADDNWVGYDKNTGMILNETIYTASVNFSETEEIGGFALTEVCPGCFNATGDKGEINETFVEKGIYDTDEFRIETTLMSETLHPGENREYTLKFISKIPEDIKFEISGEGSAAQFIDFEKDEIILTGLDTETIKILVKIPNNVEIKTYVGNMVIQATNEAIDLNKRVLFPVTLDIQQLTEEYQVVDADVTFITLTQDGGILLTTQLTNLGKKAQTQALIDYTVRNSKGDLIAQDSDFAEFYSTSTLQKVIQPELLLIKGRYLIEAVVIYDQDKIAYALDNFEVRKNFIQASLDFLKTKKFLGLKLIYYTIFLIVVGLTTAGIIYYRKWVEKKRKEALKYKVDIDYNLLPKPGLRSAIIGKIAESDQKAYVNLESLKLHTIVSGSTGSGKTICAQVICEGALMRGTHVIVFDPSAQWTGFLKKCQEPKMLNQYEEFGLSANEARSFTGRIEIIDDPKQKINIRDLLREKNPEGKEGSITIYCLNKLEPDQMDLFIANTVREIFASQPTESDKLKVLLVYDEVHRLLEKFGGKGKGFVQIERGIREFRKWGLGILLISQVSSDFIGEIKANISTEIQMRTRYENDLNRIKDNFGEKISSALVRAPVGIGMFVNAEYNKGRPYFIVVRPILHAIRRLGDEELRKYNYYSNKVEDIKYKLDALRHYDIDLKVYMLNYENLEYDYRKACNALVENDFVKLETVLNDLDTAFKPIIKNHPNIGIIRPKLVTQEMIEKSISDAKVERAKYVELEKPYNDVVMGYRELKKRLGETDIVLKLKSELLRLEQLIKELRFSWENKKAELIKQRILLLNQIIKKYT